MTTISRLRREVATAGFTLSEDSGLKRIRYPFYNNVAYSGSTRECMTWLAGYWEGREDVPVAFNVRLDRCAEGYELYRPDEVAFTTEAKTWGEALDELRDAMSHDADGDFDATTAYREACAHVAFHVDKLNGKIAKRGETSRIIWFFKKA